MPAFIVMLALCPNVISWASSKTSLSCVIALNVPVAITNLRRIDKCKHYFKIVNPKAREKLRFSGLTIVQ